MLGAPSTEICQRRGCPMGKSSSYLFIIAFCSSFHEANEWPRFSHPDFSIHMRDDAYLDARRIPREGRELS